VSTLAIIPPPCTVWDALWLVEFRTHCDHCSRAIEPGDFHTLDEEILCGACARPIALRVLGEAEPCSRREEMAKAIVLGALRGRTQ
jgi:recombinational DNA repair protein (RecF pathway)